MAFIRRGYVPTSIPITSALCLTCGGRLKSFWPAEISCFEEYEFPPVPFRFCKVWLLDGQGFHVLESFDEVAGLLSILVVDKADDAEPSDIGVKVVYANPTMRTEGAHE